MPYHAISGQSFLARIQEAFPLQCPICHSLMRIIAFINDTGTVKKILDHIGESTLPPRIAPAREPPSWKWLRRRNSHATIRNGMREQSRGQKPSSVSASPGSRGQMPKQDETR